MTATSGIYAIECRPTGRRYVGQAQEVGARLNNHRSALRRKTHPNRRLQAAWNKYGEGAFDFRPILVVSVEMLTFYEQLIADFYRDTGLFNHGEFVDNGKRGRKLGKRARDNIKRAVNAPEAVAKKSASLEAAYADAQVHKNLSDGCKRSWDGNSERRAKVSASVSAARNDPERAEAWNAALRASHQTPEFRKKMSERKLGKKSRAKISAAKRAYWKRWREQRANVGVVEVPVQ